MLPTMHVTASLEQADEAPAPLALRASAPMVSVPMMTNVHGGGRSIADAAGPKGTLVFFTCYACP